MKTLYFEGAGMDYTPNEFSNVGNYRIRTAFLNNDGKAIYIELGRCNRYRNTSLKGNKPLKKKIVVSEWALNIDHLFFIVEGEDENKTSIPHNWHEIRDNFNYTNEDITKWINETLNCNFDTMEVLPRFEGYRVHGDNGSCNLIDNHTVNILRAEAREKEYKEVDQYFRQKLNERYSVVGLLKMDDNSITIRCHASDQALKRAGLTDNDRIIIREVIV